MLYKFMCTLYTLVFSLFLRLVRRGDVSQLTLMQDVKEGPWTIFMAVR